MVRCGVKAGCLVMAGLLWCVLPAAAQVQWEGIQLSNLSGSLGAGYSGAYSNLQDSSNHGLDVNGNAALNGFYYNPNFLSFNVTPFYGMSRANSNYLSVGNSEGVSASAALFSGSHFPGTVSYSRSYNSSGNFSVPGLPDITSHGNDSAFGIGWGVNLPSLPTLSVSYYRGHDEYSLYGTDANGASSSQNFNIRALYAWAGFRLDGAYFHATSEGELPALLQRPAENSTSSSDGYSFGVSHNLPWHGSLGVSYGHSDYLAESEGVSNGGGVNNLSANAGLYPVSKLSLTMTARYFDNLAAVLNEAILTAGGPVQQTITSPGSHSLDLSGVGIYRAPFDIGLSGYASRREQTFMGQSFGGTTVGGGASTMHRVGGGALSVSVSVMDSMSDSVGTYSGSSAVGLSSNLGYSRQVGAWNVGGNFSYVQNQQTFLISYLTSSYSYGANVNRAFGRLRWVAGYNGSHSGITQQAGATSSSEGVTTSLSMPRLGVSANYSRSSGVGILTAAGIVTTPVPAPILPQTTVYGGKSYSFGIGGTPIRRLTVSFSYADSIGNTATPPVGFTYNTKSIYSLVQYRFRQMGFNGGYSRFIQGFGPSGTPLDTTAFYVGVSRWFNFF